MKLRYVIMALQPEWDEQAGRLEERLGRAGIRCTGMTSPVCPGAKDVQERKDRWQGDRGSMAGAEDALVITDDRALAVRLASAGAVCVGCSGQDDSFFDGAELVTDDLDSLDAELLEECFLRARGMPVTIARTPRLVIREIAAPDFDGLYRISRQEGMQHALCGAGSAEAGLDEDCFAPERLGPYIRTAYRLFGYGLWSVCLKDGTLIGCCGLSECERASVMPVTAAEEMAGRRTGYGKRGGENDGAFCAGQGGCGKENGSVFCGSGNETAENRRRENCLELQYMLAQEYQGKGYAQEMCRAALRYAADRTPWREVWLRIHPDNTASRRLATRLGFSDRGQTAEGLCCMVLALRGTDRGDERM